MQDEYTLKLGPIHRTMGPGGSRELIGAGFMNKKPGKDHTNYEPPFYSMCYVIEGKGSYTCKYGTFELTAGSYFQRFPGIKHSTVIHSGSRWSECFIDFGAALYGVLCQMGMIDTSQPCGFAGVDKNIPAAIADFSRTLDSCDTQSVKLLLPQMLELNQRILSGSGDRRQTADSAAISHLAHILGKNFENRLDVRKFALKTAGAMKKCASSSNPRWEYHPPGTESGEDWTKPKGCF